MPMLRRGCLLARDLGLDVRWMPFNTDTYEFDADVLDSVLTDRTRLVCVGAASNLIGTINDVKSMCATARDAGAMTFIDAVQAVPHIPIDVQETGCDFLVCSAYKFFGPHQGILWGRREVLESLEAYKVRPAPTGIPGCFETGTQSHEGMAGTTAAVDYLAWVGESMAGRLRRGPWCIRRSKGARPGCAGLSVRVRVRTRRAAGQRADGDTGAEDSRYSADPAAMHRRVPTVAFTVDGAAPGVIAAELAARNIFVWSGQQLCGRGRPAHGHTGQRRAVRVGPVHYNRRAEVDTLLNALEDIIPRARAA